MEPAVRVEPLAIKDAQPGALSLHIFAVEQNAMHRLFQG
jgi:hypothetical protein